jgi:hypothetical protein
MATTATERQVSLAFDLDELTIGDLADMEDVAGVDIQRIDLKAPPLKVLPAMVWIFNRKLDPTFTYADARAVKLTTLSIAGEAPTVAVAAGDGTAPPSAPNS